MVDSNVSPALPAGNRKPASGFTFGAAWQRDLGKNVTCEAAMSKMVAIIARELLKEARA